MRPIEDRKIDHRVWFYLPPETHRKIKAVAKADDRALFLCRSAALNAWRGRDLLSGGFRPQASRYDSAAAR